MSELLLDIKMGLRQLGRAPSTAIAVILTFAVGIGATTAVFSFIAAVLSFSQPVSGMDRRVALWSRNRSETETKRAVSPADFLDWRRRATSLDQVVAIRSRSFSLSGAGIPVRVSGSEISSGYLEFFELAPRVGRTFTEADARPGAPRVVILSERFWRVHMGARPDLVGQTIRLDGEPTTVIGILPRAPGFEGPGFEGIYMPLAIDAASPNRSDRSLFVWARLKTGTTIGQTHAEMESIGRELERERPDTNRGWTINTRPLQEEFLGPQARLVFGLLFAMAVAVLVIGCVNVANLLLARGVARQREIAVRMALGAGIWRIVRQLLVECAVLAIAGAAASLLVARWIIAFLVGNYPLESPWLEGGLLNSRMLLVTFAGALLATVAAGLMPALASRRTSLLAGLHAAGRATVGGSERRLMRTLVASEVTLAVVLLIVAGLLTRTVTALQRLEPGFDVTHLLTARVALPERMSPHQTTGWFTEAIARASALPGVLESGGTSRLPFAGSRFNPNRSLIVEGHAAINPEQGTFAIDYVVTPGYFAAMRIPLKEGRDFAPADEAGAPYVAIVSETLAKRYWTGRSPLGGHLRQGDEPPGVWRTVVAVVGDIRNDDADQPPLPYLYLPLAQQPQRALSIVLRTSGKPEAFADTFRRAMAEFDPDQPLFDVQSMEAILDADLRGSVVLIEVLNGFAGVALGLAGLGIWGVVAQLVAQRTREIGVRIALGARASQIVALIARLALVPVAAGLVAGLIAGLGAGRLIRSVLFQVAPADPLTLVATCGLLAAVAATALAAPTRRALRLDPVQVLRME